jgi:hypothetical protein
MASFFLIAVLVAGLVFGTAGCVPPPTEDGTESAARIVWGLYGETSPLPKIIWETGNCVVADGHAADNGACDAGRYSGIHTVYGYPDADHIGTIWLAWAGSYAWSRLAHELFHAHLERQTGDLDPNHTHPGWRDGTITRAFEALSEVPA